MDGTQMTYEAAQSLMTLAAAPDMATTPPALRRNSKETCTPEKKSLPRQFLMTGVKRLRDDLLTVLYSSGTETMAVPFVKGERVETFIARREQVASSLCDQKRAETFCTWRRQVISMRVDDDRWCKVRETFRERRYIYKNIQLVILRITCCKESKDEACRNCAHPLRRMQCISPTLYHYVMPLPGIPSSIEMCDLRLDEFQPIEVKKDYSAWLLRMPSCHVQVQR
jgi:hypothetical protein